MQQFIPCFTYRLASSGAVPSFYRHAHVFEIDPYPTYIDDVVHLPVITGYLRRMHVLCVENDPHLR